MAALLVVASCVGCAHVVAIGDCVNAIQAVTDDVFVGGVDHERPFVARVGSTGDVAWRWTDDRPSDIEALTVVGNDVFALAMDCVLTRLDARSGRVLAASAIGSGLCRALATDGTDLVVGGAFEGSITIGAAVLTSRGLHDVFVAKVSTGLVPRWARQIGGPGNDLARGLTRSPGGYVLTGSVAGEVPPADGAFELGGSKLVSRGDFDALVARLDDDGNAIWARALGGPGFDVAKSSRLDAQGNVYVVGSVQGIVPRPDEPAITQGHLEALFAKLSPSGKVLWEHRDRGVLSWHALDLERDRIAAIGHFEQKATVGHCVVRGAGATDVVVATFDLEGRCLHAHAIGGSGADFGYAVTWRRHGSASAGRREHGFVELAPRL